MRYLHIRRGTEGLVGDVSMGFEKLPDGKFLVSFARCSPKDQFVKRKARLICQGRLINGKYVEAEWTPETKYQTLIALAQKHDKETIEARCKQRT